MNTETAKDLERSWTELIARMRASTPSPADHAEERRLWDRIMWRKHEIGQCMVIGCHAAHLPDDEWRRCADHPQEYV